MRTHVQRITTAAVLCCGMAISTQRACAEGGVPLWTNIQTRTPHGSEVPSSIAVGRDGKVFVAARNGVYAYSNDGMPLWTNFSNGSLMAVDASGKVFVAGSSENSSNWDYVTTAYSNEGLPLWTNRYNGPGNNLDEALAIGVDSNGNLFVTGGSVAAHFNYATIKYSNSGVPLWTNRYNGPGNRDIANAIAVDSSGNVCVTGYSDAANGISDYATIKYSNSGVPLWTNRYHGLGNGGAVPSAIAVDSSGNMFVTGTSRTDGNRGYASGDYATVAYSNSGVPLWTNRYDGPANQGDEASAIAVDNSGNVFVTGSSVTVRDFIGDPPDYATIKYSNSGLPLWTNRYDGPANSDDVATAIAVDSGGNVFVTGRSRNDPSRSDYATVAYSNAGDLLWENRYNGPDNLLSGPQAMAVDRDGNVFVTGYSRSSDGFSYYTTIKYSSNLSPPVTLDYQLINDQLVLSWADPVYALQSSASLAGTFADVPGATTPYTNSITAPQQFFRLTKN